MKKILVTLLIILVGVVTYFITEKVTAQKISSLQNECGLKAVEFHRGQIWERRNMKGITNESYRNMYDSKSGKCIVHSEFSSETNVNDLTLFSRDSYLYDVSDSGAVKIAEFHGIVDYNDNGEGKAFYSKVKEYNLNFGSGAF